MTTLWDDRFDVVCGAVVVGRESEPLEDSGLWDLVHGPKELPSHSSRSPIPLAGTGGPLCAKLDKQASRQWHTVQKYPERTR
jgi:hypothetical protein